MNSGSPSRIRQVHSVEWICRWRIRHNVARLLSLVSPPSSHGVRWWISHHEIGRAARLGLLPAQQVTQALTVDL